MKKQVPFLLIICLILTSWLSCETANDNLSPLPTPQEGSEDSTVIVPDSFVTDQDTLSVEQDSILMQFFLLNGRGDTTRTFRERENMYFHLSFTNLGSSEVWVYKDICLSDQDVFRVFSEDGTDWGVPWYFLSSWKMPTPPLKPQRTYETFCSWLNYSIIGERSPFALKKDNPVLPVGRYRAIASMTLPQSEAVMTCVLHFEVIPFGTVEPSECYQIIITAFDESVAAAKVIRAPSEVQEGAPTTDDLLNFSRSDIPERDLATGDSLRVFMLGYQCYPGRLDVPTSKPYYRCQIKLIE
ncbi:MAG: hypothetical protein J5545_05990 [Bacteroidaceae bacterium]|nr:hypothetical protein [Bacteroidaceae bacterium]